MTLPRAARTGSACGAFGGDAGVASGSCAALAAAAGCGSSATMVVVAGAAGGGWGACVGGWMHYVGEGPRRLEPRTKGADVRAIQQGVGAQLRVE